MARQPIINVQVNSQQFQQFAKQFNQFTGQIRQLNANFATINASLNRTNILMRSIQGTVRVVESGLQKVFSTAKGITKQFFSWKVLIGGVTALLGMGGSLYGIERLAASIMQKRRQALGLGQDYGRTQASSIFSQGLIGSPSDTQSNIALGMHGSMDQYKALMKLGVNPATDKRSADEIQDYIIKQLPRMVQMGGQDKLLMYAHQYGIDQFLSGMDILRLSTEEGQKEYQEKQKLVAQYKDLMKVTPKAQKAWTELELQFQAAKAQLESVFGNALADLAEPLRRLSDAFAGLIRMLMQSPTVQRLIKDLSGWIDTLATKMKSLTEKDIENFVKELRKLLPSTEEFKATMKEFVEILKGAVEVLHFLRHPIDYFHQNLEKRAGDQSHGRLRLGQHLGMSRPSIGGPTPTPGGATPSSIWNNIKNFGGSVGNWFKSPIIGGSPTQAPQVGGGSSFSGQFGGNARAITPGPPAGFPGAASKMTPDPSFSDRFGNWKGSSDTPQKGGSSPLSMNNWQMNRTASLVVRNVPGSNVFMSAAGMVG